MATEVSTGSPKMSRRQTPSAKLGAYAHDDNRTPQNVHNSSGSKTSTPVPLDRTNFNNTAKVASAQDSASNVNEILAQLRVNDARKSKAAQLERENHLNKVIANLKDQHKALKQQQMDLKDDSEAGSYKDHDRSSGSDLFTPATESFDIEPQHAGERKTAQNSTEINRVMQELEAARSVINRQELELAQSRTLRHTLEQAMGPASEADFPQHTEPAHAAAQVQSLFDASAQPFQSRVEPTWSVVGDSKMDLSSTLVNTGMTRGPGWNQSSTALPGGLTNVLPHAGVTREGRANSLGFGPRYPPQTSPIDTRFPQSRTFSSGSSTTSYGMDDRLFNNGGHGLGYNNFRRSANQLRSNSTISDVVSPITPMSPYGQTLVDPSALAAVGGAGNYGYVDRGFVCQTSPVAGQFSADVGHIFANDFAIPGNTLGHQNYVMPAEPMNYRRLLDKTVSCDWKYIVDKIVCSNDQQASIFLQQKLKVGTAEQKYEIVESIVNQAYPLMINRFGNFLVQRCFEHGTPDQVIAIANAIHGNVISLSMDPFGCHVIQKSFDSVPEDHKADMVRELLRRIPDTVIHRYACHVWQKLFELRWSGEPPQIMVKVNEALQGMWHEVALGETGSLVVQNIFENCVEEEKRPAIEEVISNIDLIAHGQFGNWCIQHLCEHGSPPDKRRVIDHILKNSYNYSIDQFASKVVEKCLKIGGPEFLERYLGVITTARPGHPRIPLIDIAGDQYGNYLIQWILTNTHQHQREQVAVHIRKHMVSLRGSKFGSRVAMICSNPQSATRPGTATALVNPYGAPQQRLGGRYR